MAQGDFDPNASTGGTGLITSSTPSTGYAPYTAKGKPVNAICSCKFIAMKPPPQDLPSAAPPQL